MLPASSKLDVIGASRTSLETPTGKTTSMIFCGMLPPLLGSEASRPEGDKEDLRRARIVCNSCWVFCCGLVRGECMREDPPGTERHYY